VVAKLAANPAAETSQRPLHGISATHFSMGDDTAPAPATDNSMGGFFTEAPATEESAVAEYEKLTKENEISKATKSQDVKYKTKESKQLDKDTAETGSDKATVQSELDAILTYLKGIQDRCIAKAETYAEIVKRRDAEIAGLKEALSILDGQAVLLQTRRQLRGHA